MNFLGDISITWQDLGKYLRGPPVGWTLDGRGLVSLHLSWPLIGWCQLPPMVTYEQLSSAHHPLGLRPTWLLTVPSLWGSELWPHPPSYAAVKTWGLNTDKLWPRVILAPATANLWSCYKSIMKIETFQLKTLGTVFDRSSLSQKWRHSDTAMSYPSLPERVLVKSSMQSRNLLRNCMRLLPENWLRIELQLLKIAGLQFGVSIVRNHILLSSSDLAPGFWNSDSWRNFTANIETGFKSKYGSFTR